MVANSDLGVYVVQIVVYDRTEGSFEIEKKLYSALSAANSFAEKELRRLAKLYQNSKLRDRPVKYDDEGGVSVNGTRLDGSTKLKITVERMPIHFPPPDPLRDSEKRQRRDAAQPRKGDVAGSSSTETKTKTMERKISYEHRNHRISVVESASIATTTSHSTILK